MSDKNEIKKMIFISYSHDDIDIAKKLANRLKADGYGVWIDLSEIHATEEFSEKIVKGIDEASLFVSLFSKSYIQKDFCFDEIRCAQDFRKTIMPVFIEKVVVPPDSRFKLSFSKSELRSGKDIVSDEDFEDLYSDFITQAQWFFDDKTPHAVKTNISFPALYHNFTRLYSGGYFSKEIYKELYPAITVEADAKNSNDANGQKKLICSNNNNESLINYIEENKKSHIFITGDGGSGKTVALKHIFDYFYENEVPVIYVPLSSVRFVSNENSLETYIAEKACDKAGWDNIKQLASNDRFIPRVVLILDGLNEITGDIQSVIHEISEMMFRSNLQIVITSRVDYINKFSDTFDIKSVQFEPINENVVLKYLESQNIDAVNDKQLLQLLSNPMMLTLYTEARISSDYISKIESGDYDYDYFPIKITETPDTAGKIIWNYIISQLYKISDRTQSSEEIINCFIMIELFLPLLGFILIKNGEIDSKDFKKKIRRFRETDYYEFYIDDRLDDLNISCGSDYDAQNLKYSNIINIISKKLCLVKETNGQLDFSHQIFRDFFAALFIAKQIDNLASDEFEREYSFDTVTDSVYSEYIIKYISDILNESDACPVKNNGITYPGKKKKLCASDFSVTEQALAYFRDKTGEQAQKGVVNLFEIMKAGRRANLSNCDFSRLDLRLCTLMGSKYVDWYKDEVYPCCFDLSYINIESFIPPGHKSLISVIHTSDKGIFSGDENGTVKVWTAEDDIPSASYDIVPGEKIIDIAYSEKNNRLGILTAHALYSYDLNSAVTDILCETHNYYRYVRTDDCGEFIVSLDITPLTWQTPDGEIKAADLPFAVNSRCVAKNPAKDEYIVSLPYNNAVLFRYKNNDSNYEVLRRIDLFNDSAHIVDICYNDDGSKFIIATNKTVSEFDSASLKLLHRFISSSKVSSVKYFNGKIIVASGVNITVLNPDFSVSRTFKGYNTNTYLTILCDNDNLYLYVQNHIIALNSDFAVHRTRKLKTGRYLCVGDCNDGQCFIVISSDTENGQGYRYNFNTDELCKLTWNYEIITDSYKTDHLPYEIHKSLNTVNTVFFVNKEQPEDIREFTFYSGINIFECSFKDIKGSIKEPGNIEKIIMYGGII